MPATEKSKSGDGVPMPPADIEINATMGWNAAEKADRSALTRLVHDVAPVGQLCEVKKGKYNMQLPLSREFQDAISHAMWEMNEKEKIITTKNKKGEPQKLCCSIEVRRYH